MSVVLLVNGKRHTVDVAPEKSLLQVLRDDLGLIGCKYGCGEGQCRACTVLINGEAVSSCITQVGSLQGQQVTTVESLEVGGKLHPVQQAFIEEDALQCGYCTPGMVLAAVALLRRTPNPTDSEIRRGMQANLCRCGAYHRIEAAVRRAAVLEREAGAQS